MFEAIPAELREYKQWVCWRLEFDPARDKKPTKVPYTPRPNSGKASVIAPETWGTFEEALAAPLNCQMPVHPNEPVGKTGFSGIGFVFTANDPFCGIDLDDTHGDQEIYAEQQKVYLKFNSYTELSPSRSGVHIIVKGKVPIGRRRHCIELYPQGRFFTMTGNVYNNVPVRECQKELDELYSEFKKDVRELFAKPDTAQSEEDEAILQRAREAVNGDKFEYLWQGKWQDLNYPSQSEADFALIDILAFYTKYPPQIRRLFRMSALGQREKAKRDDYIDFMVEKSFDRQLPAVDLSGWMERLAAFNAAAGANSATEPGKRSSVEAATTATATIPAHRQTNGEGRAILPEAETGVNPFPPGLLGEVAQFFYEAAPRPAYDLALAGAIGFLSGLTGRAYNVSNAGLNQYILMLAQTGVGKDAIASGRSKLTQALLPSCPSIIDFVGPGELVSSAGLIKWLANKSPCIFSILGEFGKKLKEMAAPNANSHLQGLSRVLLQLYSKSGSNEVFDPMAYSDKEKNTAPIKAPSLTLFGESVPETFYEALDETMIADGLLPRFLVFENKTARPYLNKFHASVLPPLDLVRRLNDLAAYCLGVMHRQSVHPVELTADAEAKFDEFDKWTTDEINNSQSDVIRQLWNRAHLKSLKLAALRAVGDNYLAPVVTVEHCMWATELVVSQTRHLIAKFETGQIGAMASTGEAKQLTEVVKAIKDFMNDYDKYEKYGGRRDMYAKGVILESAIQRKVICLACFRHDRMGQKFALKKAIDTLLEADDLREVPKSQMFAEFNVKPRAFQIANLSRFSEI